MSILDHAWGESPTADRVRAMFAGMRPSLISNRGLMVLQAFIDDSRDAASGTYVLAGYIASVENWTAFAAQWERLLPLATKNKNGIHRFKMTEMNRRGRMKDVALFHSVITEHVEMSVACVIDANMLRDVVDRIVATADFPNWGELELNIDQFKVKWRDPFYFCFRAIMDGFHKKMHEESEFVPFRSPVDFIFDREEANENFVRSIWQEYLDRRPDEHRKLYGRVPQFEADEEFVALQAADFRAWWIRKWALELGAEKAYDGAYPFAVDGCKKVPGLLFTATEDQMLKITGEALGAGVQELVKAGGQLPVIPGPLTRFWPRETL